MEIHNHQILLYFIYVSKKKEIHSNELKCRQQFSRIFLNMVSQPSVIHKLPYDGSYSFKAPILLLASYVSLKQLRTNPATHSYFVLSKKPHEIASLFVGYIKPHQNTFRMKANKIKTCPHTAPKLSHTWGNTEAVLYMN